MLKRSVVFLLVLMIVGVFAVAAYATSTDIGANLNRDGSLIQFATWRNHAVEGGISMDLYNNTHTYTKLGLREYSGWQFTDSEQWSQTGFRRFNFRGNPNDYNFIPRWFAVNGRMGATYWPMDNYFAGTLTY